MTDTVGLLLVALVVLSCLALWSMTALVTALVLCGIGLVLYVVFGMKS